MTGDAGSGGVVKAKANWIGAPAALWNVAYEAAAHYRFVFATMMRKAV